LTLGWVNLGSLKHLANGIGDEWLRRIAWFSSDWGWTNWAWFFGGFVADARWRVVKHASFDDGWCALRWCGQGDWSLDGRTLLRGD
jgi:hypothetical protein